MYFYPDAGRMYSVEVLKGAAIGNGPRTTAGTINYISRPIPTAQSEGYLSQSFGDDGYQDRTRITVETLVPLVMLLSTMTIVQMDIKILKEPVTLLIADLTNKVIC